MAGKNVNLSPILSNPAAAAAFFASVVRQECSRYGKDAVGTDIRSVSYADGAVTVRFGSRIAAAEFSLIRPEAERSLSEAAARLGFGNGISLRIR